MTEQCARNFWGTRNRSVHSAIAISVTQCESLFVRCANQDFQCTRRNCVWNSRLRFYAHAKHLLLHNCSRLRCVSHLPLACHRSTDSASQLAWALAYKIRGKSEMGKAKEKSIDFAMPLFSVMSFRNSRAFKCDCWLRFTTVGILYCILAPQCSPLAINNKCDFAVTQNYLHAQCNNVYLLKFSNKYWRKKDSCPMDYSKIEKCIEYSCLFRIFRKYIILCLHRGARVLFQKFDIRFFVSFFSYRENSGRNFSEKITPANIVYIRWTKTSPE